MRRKSIKFCKNEIYKVFECKKMSLLDDEYKYNLIGNGFAQLKVIELKELLRQNKLPVSGVRKVLILRLQENGINIPSEETNKFFENTPQSEKNTSSLLSSELISNTNKETHVGTNCNIDFYPAFFTEDTSKKLYDHILEYFELPKIVTRRYNKTYGDDGLVYQVKFGGYKGIPEKIVNRIALPWDKIPFLSHLRDLVEKTTNTKYTYCAIQYYHSGKIHIKRHVDREMTPGSIIAGLSLGQCRTLRVESFRGQSMDLRLFSGSLYVLNPPTNDFWMHSIPPDDTNHPRLSLTFRTLI